MENILKHENIGKILLIVGGIGFATAFIVGFIEEKQQGTSTPTFPSWYTSTLGPIDNLLPSPGTFGWLAIAGAGLMLYQKFGKK